MIGHSLLEWPGRKVLSKGLFWKVFRNLCGSDAWTKCSKLGGQAERKMERREGHFRQVLGQETGETCRFETTGNYMYWEGGVCVGKWWEIRGSPERWRKAGKDEGKPGEMRGNWERLGGWSWERWGSWDKKPHSVLLGVFLPVLFSLPTRALPAGLGKACAKSGRREAAVTTFLPTETCAVLSSQYRSQELRIAIYM